MFDIIQVEGRFYVNKALEKLMFEELRNACRSDGIGGFLPAVRQVGNVAALPAIVSVSHIVYVLMFQKSLHFQFLCM